MALWIPITIAAAFFQNLRSGLQKGLTGRLSVSGASYVRFAYALPFALLAVALLFLDRPLPGVNAQFAVWVSAAALAQIAATSALVAAFTRTHFAGATAVSKTEVAQTALFGLWLLGDTLDWRLMVSIAVSFVGVLLLSQRRGLAAFSRPGAALLYGLGAGAGVAIASVCFRGASLALADGAWFERAAFTLAVGLVIQTMVMGAWLAAREPGQLTDVASAWRVARWVGLCGMLASLGWFSAMTLENAAAVRAVGQIELLFAFVTSVRVFREHVRARELAGIALLTAGVLLLVT
jgi:drug/metabolite transporter (DMT)-like permease